MSIVEQRLENLSAHHDNVYVIFGGAYFAHDAIIHNDFATFVEFLPHVVQTAKLCDWHTGIAGALRTFCYLCMVDSALVEVYLGMKFSELEVR